MLHRITRNCCLLVLTFAFLAPVTTSLSTPGMLYQHYTIADFPTVDPDYIYDQLFYMATHFQHREAGYDSNLPVDVNGHDEFATYWSQEMVKNLQDFGPQIRLDKFPVQGWRGRPATVPAFNVEVSVPGVTQPELVVVIGCHYDGMANSTQSANDDASGCAIGLGIARAMGEYWRSHNTYPARTLRFVLFDAEEQGLFGSDHYANSTINGDLQNIVAMFNEEQNGIAYPLRYLGKATNPLLPLYIMMSPLHDSFLYQTQSQLSQRQREHIMRFRALMQQAVAASFEQFRAMGYQMLSYHTNNSKDVFQPTFTSYQMNNIHLQDDDFGHSDQVPFTLAGVPCATFEGNYTYYHYYPPPWSYPYDQPDDTIQLMNTFANGSTHKAQALALALALPEMLTTWMLNQPDILGQNTADESPIAAISDIGQTQVNQRIYLDARTSFDPNSDIKDLTYRWNFGDRTTASGVTVNHTYMTPGNYALTLIVSSHTGSRRISKLFNVYTQMSRFSMSYRWNLFGGAYSPNYAVSLPIPDDRLADRVMAVPTPTPTPVPITPTLIPTPIPVTPTSLTSTPSTRMPGVSINLVVGISMLIVVLGIGILLVMSRKKQVAPTPMSKPAPVTRTTSMSLNLVIGLGILAVLLCIGVLVAISRRKRRV